MRTIFTAGVILLIVACSVNKKATTTAPNTTSNPATIAQEDFHHGEALYNAHCGNCHKLYKPDSRNEQAWNEIVPEMVHKTNKRAGKEEIDSKGQEQILKYLIAMSNSPTKK